MILIIVIKKELKVLSVILTYTWPYLIPRRLATPTAHSLRVFLNHCRVLLCSRSWGKITWGRGVNKCNCKNSFRYSILVYFLTTFNRFHTHYSTEGFNQIKLTSSAQENNEGEMRDILYTCRRRSSSDISPSILSVLISTLYGITPGRNALEGNNNYNLAHIIHLIYILSIVPCFIMIHPWLGIKNSQWSNYAGRWTHQ